MIDVPQHHHKPERDRVMALGRRTDTGERATLVAINEADGAWTIHGLGGELVPAVHG